MADYDFIAQGVRPLTDPTVQAHNAASAALAQQEARNAGEQRKLLKQQQTENDLKVQGQQRALYEQGVIQAGVARNGGDIGKALQDPDVVANVNPATVLSMGKLHGENAKLHSEAEQHIAKAGMDNAQTGEVVHKYLGGLARGVIQQEYSPDSIQAMLTHAANFGNGVYRKEAMQAMQAIQQNPQAAKQIVDQIYQSSPIFAEDQKLANEKLTAQGHADQGKASLGQAEAKIPGEQAESAMKQKQAEMMNSLTPEKLPALVNSVIDPASHPELNKRTMAQIQGAQQLGLGPQALQAILKDSADQIGRTETAVATAKATAPIKISVNAAQQNAQAMAGTTEDDYKRAGEQYALSGVMPAMGRGGVARQKINHYAQEYARENGMSPKDLLVAQSAFQGDKASLAAFQKQRDQIVSFERTAQKNLDLFLDAAAKIPDTGVPWLNTPIRQLDEKLIGSAAMSAVNAARQVANNEIAKVTSGGGLSGVLSDTARKEVSNYNPANATFAQTLAVAKVLKQDMANRHESMDAMLGEIKGRTGNPGSSSAPKATHRFNPATGKIEEIK